MTLSGYGGKALRIDLTTGEIKKEPLDKDLAGNYIGGFGMAQKLAYDFLPAGLDPWAPEAPIIICPGFLNGTLAPSSSKVSMTTKDPASNTISTWFGSLHFGTRLRWAGYDNVVITGKASRPVYLKIIDDEVEICNAGDLWGKTDMFETVDVLKERHGNTCSVATIGPAGENMVKISMVFIDKGTTWGRAAGSTWASKNLKAIVVDGTRGIKVANIEKFMRIIDKTFTMAMKDPNRNNWKYNALYFIWPLWENAGYLSTKNWRETAPKNMIMGPLGAEEYKKRRAAIFGCPACVAPDKAVMEIKEGEDKGLLAPISTPIDPAMAFGARLNIDKMDDFVKLTDMSNRAGIDAMTFTAMVGWVIELYEKGILTKEDTGGLELKGGYEVTRKLLEMSIKNEGFGAIIASGFTDAEKKIGKGSEKYAYEVKGTEPDFDARGSLGLETFTSQVNTRPARDLPIGGLTVATGRKPEFFKKVISRTGYIPEEKIEQIFTQEGFDLPRLSAHYEYWGCILDMMGICFRMQSSSLWNVRTLAELYSAATGINKTPEELLHDAERAVNLVKFLNAREGFNRKDDRF
ncbi:MAG: aldehyde ferredoxin oxidoreductase N-terminal domain-containing protein, partial [Thermodesulfobacteriota bacterium]|nr:aldehyde ferredoxin oxidoreductase N-terminal domain-containing protein [Thermodesulfobacteriota bacterium]